MRLLRGAAPRLRGRETLVSTGGLRANCAPDVPPGGRDLLRSVSGCRCFSRFGQNFGNSMISFPDRDKLRFTESNCGGRMNRGARAGVCRDARDRRPMDCALASSATVRMWVSFRTLRDAVPLYPAQPRLTKGGERP